MKRLFLFINALIFGAGLNAQSVFFKQFGNISSNSACYKIIKGDNESIITCGYEKSMGDSYGYPGRRILLTKFSQSGNIIWSKAIGSGTETAYDLISTHDNGYLIVGCYSDFGDGTYSNQNDAFAVKTDSGFNVQWAKKYSESIIYNAFRAVTQTSNGDFIFAGTTNGLAGLEFNIALVKTNSMGDTIWTRSFGSDGWDYVLNDIAYDIISTNDDGCLIVGQIGVENIWNRYFPFVFKISANGIVEWRKLYYGSASSDYGYSITTTEDGNFAILCKSHIIKIDSNGDIVWSVKLPSGWAAEYSNNPYNAVGSISATYNGGIVVCGRHNLDACIIKLDGNGIIEWAKSYDNGRAEMACSIIQLSSGQFAVGGLTRDVGINIDNSFLLVTDIFGNLGNCATIRNYTLGTGTEIAYPITPLVNKCYIGTPISFNTNSVNPGHFSITSVCEADYTILDSDVIDNYISIYPNPASLQCMIDLFEPSDADCKLEIVSSDGKLVKTLFISTGQTHLTLPISDLSNGVYFVAYQTSSKRKFVDKLIISN